MQMRQHEGRQVRDSHTGYSALYVVKVTADKATDTQTPQTHQQSQHHPSQHVILTVTVMAKSISVTADDGMSGSVTFTLQLILSHVTDLFGVTFS